MGSNILRAIVICKVMRDFFKVWLSVRCSIDYIQNCTISPTFPHPHVLHCDSATTFKYLSLFSYALYLDRPCDSFSPVEWGRICLCQFYHLIDYAHLSSFMTPVFPGEQSKLASRRIRNQQVESQVSPGNLGEAQSLWENQEKMITADHGSMKNPSQAIETASSVSDFLRN